MAATAESLQAELVALQAQWKRAKEERRNVIENLPGGQAKTRLAKTFFDLIARLEAKIAAHKQVMAAAAAEKEEAVVQREESVEGNREIAQERAPVDLYTQEQQAAQSARMAQQESFANQQVATAQQAMDAPSAAAMQLRAGADIASNQVASNVASQRGINPALAARMANNQTASIMQQTNTQAAQMQAQEQDKRLSQLMAAQGNAAGTYGNTYGQGSGDARAQGSLTQTQRGQNDAYEGQITGQDFAYAGLDQAQSQFDDEMVMRGEENETARKQAAAQAKMAEQAREDQKSQDKKNFWLQAAGTGVQAAGMIAASDKNSKKNIKPTDGLASRMLDELKPVTWDYKDSHGGEKDYAGIIAQDLEKSELGKSLIVETDKGKHVDMKRGLFAIMAASVETNERLKKLEAK